MKPRSEELASSARRWLASAGALLEGGFAESASADSYYAVFYAARAALSEADRYAKTHDMVAFGTSSSACSSTLAASSVDSTPMRARSSACGSMLTMRRGKCPRRRRRKSSSAIEFFVANEGDAALGGGHKRE